MRRLLLFLVCIHARSLAAQEYTFQDEWLDHSAMLSSPHVYQVIQDLRGYTWVATAEGLNRYDGTGTRTFVEDGSRDGMPGNVVYALLEYRPGLLMIGTGNGTCILNTITGEFEPNPIAVPELRAGSGKRVYSFNRDSKGRVWVSHQDGYDLLDSSLQKLLRISDQPWARDLQGSHVSDAGWTEDSQGRFWLPTDVSGVIIVDEKNQSVQSWRTHRGQAPYFQRIPIHSFWLDEARHEAWFGSWGNGLVKFDMATKRTREQRFGFTRYGDQSTINHITPLNDSLLLCYTGYGPFMVNRQTMDAIRPAAWLYNGNRKYTIRRRMMDRFGNTWEWGSEGFYQILRVRDSARMLALHPAKTKGALDMLQIGKQVYMAFYYEGLLKLDLERKTYLDVPLPEDAAYGISSLALDAGGNVLAGSVGISSIDTLHRKFNPLMQGNAPFMRQAISDIHTAPDGTVWWAALDTPMLGAWRTRNGASYLLRVSLPITAHDKAASAREILGIRHDRDGRLWMWQKGSTQVLCLDPLKWQWKIYQPPLKGIGLGYLPTLGCLHPGTDGVLWLSSPSGGGLIRFDTRDGTVSSLRRKQGLSSDIIYDICPDNQGNLFLNTSKGIDLFNPSRREVVGFVPWTKQMSLETSGKMVFDSVHQRLMLGTSLGVVLLPRSIWLTNPAIPTVNMDKLLVSNKHVPLPGKDKPLMLHPGRNSLSIFFSAVDYNAGNELLFSYTLDSRDREWSGPSPARSANYTELPPGNYRFLVRAITTAGSAGEITELKVTVLPYFWQTTLFRILVLAGLAGLAWWYFQSRIDSLKQEAALQRRMAETEMNLLRSQINPHFIFNCLSAIDNLIQTHQVDKATTYLARFARMLRSVIESTRYEALPIQKDIENLRNYILLEQFMCNGKFEFRIDIDPSLEGSDVKVPPMIIQPFVENAIRHGLLNKLKGERFLRIGIALDQDLVRYTITDSGVGREAAIDINRLNRRGHQSFGLQITSDRIRLLNRSRETSGFSVKDLYEGETAVGTQVEVWIDTTTA